MKLAKWQLTASRLKAREAHRRAMAGTKGVCGHRDFVTHAYPFGVVCDACNTVIRKFLKEV